MADDGRRMVAYEYGRNDFEMDLWDYSMGKFTALTDKQWNDVQDKLQETLNEVAEEAFKQIAYQVIERLEK